MSEIEITLFGLSVQDVNLILAALGEMPHKQVVNLVPRLAQMAQEQIDKQSEAENADTK